MDPLSALGLASNIVQFVEFGATIFRETKEIADAGSTISTSYLADLANDFSTASAALKHSYSTLSSSPAFSTFSTEEIVSTARHL